MDELSIDYPLKAEQIDSYRRDGFVKLPRVLSQAVLTEYGNEFTRLVHELSRQALPLAERNTYGKAFLQIPNLWEHSEKVKAFVLCRRLGKIAAELMGVGGVRMYHDQALYKEPGGGLYSLARRPVLLATVKRQYCHRLDSFTGGPVGDGATFVLHREPQVAKESGSVNQR